MIITEKDLKEKEQYFLYAVSRAHHYNKYLLKDLEMEVIIASYEFTHRDDYEGHKIIPEIKEAPHHKILDTYHFERVIEKMSKFLQPAHRVKSVHM